MTNISAMNKYTEWQQNLKRVQKERKQRDKENRNLQIAKSVVAILIAIIALMSIWVFVNK